MRKHEGEEAIHYCWEKCENIYNFHRANDHSHIDNQRLLCHTQILNGNKGLRLCPRNCLCKEAQRVFDGHATDLIYDDLETNDPREYMILDLQIHVTTECCQHVKILKDKLQLLHTQRCYAKNENYDEVPEHTDDPVDVIVETIDHKSMVEAADV